MLTVAEAAVASRDGEVAGRARSTAGRWIVVQGAPLHPSGQVVVLLGPASPEHLAPLLMQAYGLTTREREVVQQLLSGASTATIARRLGIADDTVQQHVSSAFAKTGTGSRGELVGRVFLTHYEPRVRDNEERTTRATPGAARTDARRRPMRSPRVRSGLVRRTR